MTTLRYGYTLHEIDGLARSATVAAGFGASNYRDRLDDAWGAIVETLYAAEQGPNRRELWYAGRDAVLAAIRDDRRHYGAPTHDRSAALASAPGFVRYWGNIVTPDFSPALIERYAAFQIWPEISESHREALLALAATGTVSGAAELLGLSPSGAQTKIDRARTAFRALWHQHEQPSGLWRKTQAAHSVAGLHPCGTTAAYQRHRRRKETADEACATAWRIYRRDKKRAQSATPVGGGR